jgi:uncharacterized Zn finger protein (UPF0148 family)
MAQKCDRCGSIKAKKFKETEKGLFCQTCLVAVGLVKESWSKKNPEKAAAYHKQRRSRDAEKISEQKKAWYEKNKDHVTEKAAQRYIENREEVLAKKRQKLLLAKMNEDQIFEELKSEDQSPPKTSVVIRQALLNMKKEEKKDDK